jgi:hypothetical protein
MSDVIVPGWLIWIMIGGILPSMIWLIRETYNNKQDIAINTANDVKHGEELDKIYKEIESSEKRLQDSFSRLEGMVHKFISDEMRLLKEIIAKK